MPFAKTSLIVAALSACAFASTPGGACHPVQIGELRVYKNKSLCLDIADYGGTGNVDTYDCEGTKDQQIMKCDDGTLRNMQLNQCITTDSSGKGNVYAGNCVYFPEIPSYQKWDFISKGTFHDAGVSQQVFEIRNHASNLCLDISGTSGSGNADIYTCTGEDDQKFYFRNRGKVVKQGRLYNEHNRQCLDVRVIGVNCDNNQVNQHWTFYENGEIINASNNKCLDVAGYSGGGAVDTYYCEDVADQMWSSYCENDYCYYINRKASNNCLDARNAGNQPASQTCSWTASQQFKFIDNDWEPTYAHWIQKSCNTSGSLTYSLKTSVSYTQSVSTSVTTEISTTMKEGVIFESTELTTSISSTISSMFESTVSQEETTTFTCDYNQDGSVFKVGCMYQLQTTNKNKTNGQTLSWMGAVVACNKNDEVPKCGPFYQCTDSSCTGCKPMQ